MRQQLDRWASGNIADRPIVIGRSGLFQVGIVVTRQRTIADSNTL
jgi:hypothetical protein